MKLHYKGHAVHVILAHFPSALFPSGLFFEIGFLAYKAEGLLQAAFYCESLGVVAGFAVLLTGGVDLYGIYQRRQYRIMKTGLIHGTLNATVAMVFLLISVERLEAYPAIPSPSWGIVTAEGLAVATLAVANFLGARVHHAIIKHNL